MLNKINVIFQNCASEIMEVSCGQGDIDSLIAQITEKALSQVEVGDHVVHGGNNYFKIDLDYELNPSVFWDYEDWDYEGHFEIENCSYITIDSIDEKYISFDADDTVKDRNIYLGRVSHPDFVKGLREYIRKVLDDFIIYGDIYENVEQYIECNLV